MIKFCIFSQTQMRFKKSREHFKRKRSFFFGGQWSLLDAMTEGGKGPFWRKERRIGRKEKMEKGGGMMMITFQEGEEGEEKREEEKQPPSFRPPHLSLTEWMKIYFPDCVIL